MDQTTTQTPGRIFISYRREETAYPAGWLFDRLSEHYDGQVFKDVDSIEPGDDFVEKITAAVSSCDVLLALIGDEWLTLTDADGRRRIDHPDDFVRIEIEAALTRNVRVIPILVGGARMPSSDELPAGLSLLARRQALELSPSRFDFDTGRLLRVLDRTLHEVRESTPNATGAVSGTVAPRPATPPRPDVAASDPAPAGRPVAPEPAQRHTAPSADEPAASPARRALTPRTLLVVGGLVLLSVIALVIALTRGDEPSPAASDSGSPGSVLLEDEFSDEWAGWDDGSATSGHYVDGVYLLDTSTDDGADAHGGSPRNVPALFPQTPSAIRIEVDARMVAGEDSDHYGVTCRESEIDGNGRGYAFSIEAGSVAIWKFTSEGSTELARTDSSLNRTETHRLDITCANGPSGVDLALTIEGDAALSANDAESPYLSGTMSLYALPHADSPTPVKVEFDNVRVTQE